jgi:hypothetical protein
MLVAAVTAGSNVEVRVAKLAAFDKCVYYLRQMRHTWAVQTADALCHLKDTQIGPDLPEETPPALDSFLRLWPEWNNLDMSNLLSNPTWDRSDNGAHSWTDLFSPFNQWGGNGDATLLAAGQTQEDWL